MPLPDWLDKWIEKTDDPVKEPVESRIDLGDVSTEDALPIAGLWQGDVSDEDEDYGG